MSKRKTRAAKLFPIFALLLACSCGSENPPPLIAVLSAFPAELKAVLERAEVDETVVVDGVIARIGRLGGVPAVITMTGIGLVNATNTTRVILDRFPVTGVVFSGVAGSPQRIADVVVPSSWLVDHAEYATDRRWLTLAYGIAAQDGIEFERCTAVTLNGVEREVCLPHQPTLAIGGVGESSDPFGGTALQCQIYGGDVFGCDDASFGTAPATTSARMLPPGPPIVQDMETAAVAREAAARGLPLIGFRGVSDGEGDPLNLPGFPLQFFAYYRLAADNAAAAATAFLAKLGSTL